MRPDRDKVLGGRYRLDDRIAVGGMGEVWRATDDVLGRTVAVKVLKEEYASDAGFLERFRAEARHSAALTHPNVAGVYDYGETESSPYLVMELVPGEPLSDTLAREGAMDVGAIMPVLAQAAEGLASAHAAGLVHRDVKPGNLLVTPDGRVKITDFGIARAGDQAPLTRTGQVMGTAQYLAPEQAMGRPATPAGDVYALGVVGYEALAGRRPFRADSQVALAMAHVNEEPPPLPASVTPAARELVTRAMAKEPLDRPADAATFAAAARAIARGDDAAALDLLGVAGGGAATAAFPTTAGPGTAATQAMGGAGTGAIGAGALGAGAGAGAPATGAGGAAPGPVGRPRRRLTGPLVALLALLAFVVAGALLARPLLGGEPTTAPSAPATSQPAPTTTSTAAATEPPQQTSTPSAPPVEEAITLDPADYVGRDRESVGADLESLGLRVREQGEAATDEAAGTVLSLSPTEGLVVGDVVTLVYADPPAETTPSDSGSSPTGDGGEQTTGSGQGGGNQGNGNQGGGGNQGNGNQGGGQGGGNQGDAGGGSAGASPTQGAQAPALPGVGVPGGPGGVGTGTGAGSGAGAGAGDPPAAGGDGG